MSGQKIAIIVAMAKNNRVIGLNNPLPWHLPEDLKYFKELTSGQPVIMGRHTWLSLKQPLPMRRNLVISRDIFFTAEGAEVFHSLFDALAVCRKEETVWIIGGANVYKQALPLASDLYLTEIETDVEGDAFFPEFDLALWKQINRQEHIGKNGIPYAFIHYQRQTD